MVYDSSGASQACKCSRNTIWAIINVLGGYPFIISAWRPNTCIQALWAQEYLAGEVVTFFGYPPRLVINDSKCYELKSPSSHEWLDEIDLETMRQKFTHPLWEKLRLRANGGIWIATAPGKPPTVWCITHCLGLSHRNLGSVNRHRTIRVCLRPSRTGYVDNGATECRRAIST